MTTTSTFKSQADRPAARRPWLSRWSDPDDATLAVILLAPATILLGVMIVYPVSRLIYTSFLDLSLTSGLPPRFAGLANFRQMPDDPVFWQATWNTVLITLLTVPGSLLVGFALALLANLPFRVKWPVRLSLLIPWALPLSFAGLIFGWFFHSEYGVVNDVLNRIGLPGVIWFNSPRLAFAAICLAIIWKASSFMAMIILAGLQTIPRSLYEAADVDGAGRVTAVFRGHAAAAQAHHRRRADLPYHHRAADFRHSLHDDGRRAGYRNRDAGHVHSSEHRVVPRPRLRIGASGGDVRAVDAGHCSLPSHDPR